MVSEFTLINRHFKRQTRHTVLGVGDDAAVLSATPGMELVVSTDMLVAGTHFLDDTDPADLGWKTLAVNLSDLAAMGALPRWAFLAAALPDADEPWIAAFAGGLFDCAGRFGVDLAGGDTTRGPLNFCVTIIGEVPAGQALLRSGAQADDEIWVSGQPGRAALALAHLQRRCTLAAEARGPCLAALHRPQPRVALGLALRGLASAAIDVSDGLLADLGHILEASQVGADIHMDRLPRDTLTRGIEASIAQDSLLAGGDDYELVFTVPGSGHAQVEAISGQLGLALTCIGSTTAAEGREKRGEHCGELRLLDGNGQLLPIPRRGYDHFG